MSEKPIAYRGDEPFVFVSYAHADAELAYPLIAGLQERGLRIWYDEGMDTGAHWGEAISNRVKRCAAMLCLISTRFTDSDNCMDEIYYAKRLKKELLILHLEDVVLPDIFEFHYGRRHALRLSSYPDRNRLLDRLAATEKLRCCLGEVKAASPEPEESAEEPFRPGGNNAMLSCAEEVKRLRHAADKGDVESITILGGFYFMVQSYEEAIKWYRRATEKGDAAAMNELGECYRHGLGVAQSLEEAVKWYSQAANKAYTPAMFSLSAVTSDQEQADYWSDKAGQVLYGAAR